LKGAFEEKIADVQGVQQSLEKIAKRKSSIVENLARI
jgi:hypothetical protein